VRALVATLVLNIALLLSMACPERGNVYFGFALYEMGVMTTPVIIVLAWLLTALIIAGYHYTAQHKAARIPSQSY
jgi:small-conductance mechanosensitive channel